MQRGWIGSRVLVWNPSISCFRCQPGSSHSSSSHSSSSHSSSSHSSSNHSSSSSERSSSDRSSSDRSDRSGTWWHDRSKHEYEFGTDIRLVDQNHRRSNAGGNPSRHCAVGTGCTFNREISWRRAEFVFWQRHHGFFLYNRISWEVSSYAFIFSGCARLSRTANLALEQYWGIQVSACHRQKIDQPYASRVSYWTFVRHKKAITRLYCSYKMSDSLRRNCAR